MAGAKQAGILGEEPEEDEAMPEAEAEEPEDSAAAEQEREQDDGSHVASLLQQTSLEDHPGEPNLLAACFCTTRPHVTGFVHCSSTAWWTAYKCSSCVQEACTLTAHCRRLEEVGL